MQTHNSMAQPYQAPPAVHLYDLLQEATGGLKGLNKYTPRGYNMSQGIYVIPEDVAKETSEHARYLISKGINQNPAVLQTIPNNHDTLTQGAIQSYQDISRHAKQLGLTQLETFIHSQQTLQFAHLAGLSTPYATPQQASEIVEASNNKGQFLQFLAQQGLKVPRGKRVHSLEKAQAVFTHLLESDFPAAFVKITRSASGDGTICTHNVEQLIKVLSEPRFSAALSDGEIYIDGLIPYTQSPSVLFEVSKNDYKVLGSNYQILAKKSESDLVPTVHKGATGPISDDHMKLMDRHIVATVQFLQNQGYQGQANVEGLLTQAGDYFTIETNARQTGATTPSLESQMMEKKHQRPNFWYCNNNLEVNPDTSSTQVLECLEDILYNDKKDWGVIISNFAIISSGKVQLTIHAPNQGFLNELMQETHIRLDHLN